jgi:hypothetical protein
MVVRHYRGRIKLAKVRPLNRKLTAKELDLPEPPVGLEPKYERS